ncbi:unnamed protein product [Cladocopium goreaui]|uniref:Uncharacterized protein n=1 Tax=Cladocopium goreaui TaxID=2562237 RepID=A0A9P1GC26_9DINO|nr:unnamed protein product [Cladocopium goreaui]
MNAAENPTIPGPGTLGESGFEHGEHGHQDDQSKSPVIDSKEDEERGRSRSPRPKLNVPEPNPESPLEVLSACTSLAVGVTSMVAALKTSSEKLEVLIGNTQSLQNDLVRKHLEWSMNRTFGDMMKEAVSKGTEDASRQYGHWSSFSTHGTCSCTSTTTPAMAVATFAGYSPAKVGEPPMGHPANLDVPFMKNPPVCVLDESTGGVRNVSPTRQLNPATGTAAFSPLGYMVLKNSTDYRRIYP